MNAEVKKLKVAYFWTEKKTGTEWYETFEGGEFETVEKRSEWLDSCGRRAWPRYHDFMPQEIAEKTRKQYIDARMDANAATRKPKTGKRNAQAS